jgi:hypothetical protein
MIGHSGWPVGLCVTKEHETAHGDAEYRGPTIEDRQANERLGRYRRWRLRGYRSPRMNTTPDHAATWYTQTAASMRRWAPLTFDLDTDVCVIGGGLAGITIARELARRGWSVALIEADSIASHASGRSLGFVVPTR